MVATTVSRSRRTAPPRRPGRPARSAAGPGGREAILPAALAAFARYGFEGTNLTHIAAEAGVNQALIHYHFGDKPGLWKAVVSNAFEEFKTNFRGIEEQSAEIPPLALIRAVTRQYVAFLMRRPDIARLIFLELTQPTERTRWLMENHALPAFAAFARIMVRAQNEGVLKKMPLMELLDFINGAIIHFTLSQRVMGEVMPPAGRKRNPDDEVERISALLVNLLLNGVGGHG